MGTNYTQNINRRVKNKGITKIRFGIALFVIAILVQLISYFTEGYFNWRVFKIAYKICVPAAIALFWGFKQYRLTDDKSRYEESREVYGVEEPDETWECPKCGAVNPNMSFVCKSCRYSLE